jgi:2-polyprenyl-6-methoxyphenol hydroxylase-like FAD-dependent oxidoreductase
MTVIVAGAGIGGLSCALFLDAAGIDATVYEAVPEVRELGVGVNIQPHAVRALARIDLADELVAIGNPCLEWTLMNHLGQRIWSEPRGERAGEDWPQVSVHRGRLQSLLLRTLLERRGPDTVKTDRRLVSYTLRDDAAVARFATRAGSEEEVEGSALVGADGLHSALRHAHYPAEGDPLYAGHMLWRGVTTQAPFLDGSTMIIAGHAEQKLIAYPITRPDANGECLVNWNADIAVTHMLAREDWNRAGRLEDFVPLYEEWRFPWLDVPALLRDSDAVYEYPMVDRDPLPRWSFDRATLLGDAAHPMYPIGANGASQAIRDASAFADELVAGPSTAEALTRYEEVRRPVTTNVVRANRAGGAEQMMELVHERAPDGFRSIEDVLPRAELERIASSYWAATGAQAASSGR